MSFVHLPAADTAYYVGAKQYNAGQLACMGSLLGAPGGSGGSLLGQADSFALKVRSLLLPGVQDPSNQCLLQYLKTLETAAVNAFRAAHQAGFLMNFEYAM
jgi:hypothetical protein